MSQERIRAGTHERYDTERKGFWLKTSLSRNRFSKSHDIGGYGTRRLRLESDWGRDRRRRGDSMLSCPCSSDAGRSRRHAGLLQHGATNDEEVDATDATELSRLESFDLAVFFSVCRVNGRKQLASAWSSNG